MTSIPFVIDNQQHNMADVLNDLLHHHRGHSLDVATACFNVGGWQLLRDSLNWLVTVLKVLPDKEGRQGIDIVSREHSSRGK